jgi:hypothetical protein
MTTSVAGSEIWFDDEHGAVVVNESGLGTPEIFNALSVQAPEVAAMVKWGQNIHQSRSGSLVERDRYVTPANIYDQFRVAYDASVSDDVVGGFLDTSESLAFSKMTFECDDDEEEDIWNQVAANIDLDARLREMWRDLAIYGQFYCVTWWGKKSYKVRGRSKKGVKRKKQFPNLNVPVAMALLDPLKVVPVGNTVFNRDQLAYIANRGEVDEINKAINGEGDDAFARQVLVKKYIPGPSERAELADLGIPVDRLYLMNPLTVWRHTATKASYEKFASVRMRSVFELLDLKNQLRQMDRAHLIGGTNFIILIKKGTDQLPAEPSELAALANQTKILSRVPVIIGDHRLEIEIITPSQDATLLPARYNILDARITARMYGMFVLGGSTTGAQSDDSLKLTRIIARGMEGRRHMLRRSLEAHVFNRMFDTNDELNEEAKLTFHPKRIALDFDATVAAFLQDLRDRGDLSRDSMLSEMDYDQADEARKREREREKYDKIFETIVPFNGDPNAGPQNKPAGTTDVNVQRKAGGRAGGGNRNGGGSAPGSGQGQAPRNPRKKAD